ERNEIGPKIAKAKKAGEDASALLARGGEIGKETKALDKERGEAEHSLNEVLLTLPNLALPEVPVGTDESANVEIRRSGARRTFEGFEGKPHYELTESLGLVDMTRGAKLAGSSWPLYTGPGAALERALIQLFLDTQTREHGYTEMMTPFVANRETMTGTGQLPKFIHDMYHLADDDLFLIPTSEVTLTNIYRGEILPGAELPKQLTAYSPCFRREAGAAGKDTRGVQRVHQFNKVEMVQITREDQSADALEAMVTHATTLLERLGLEHRVIVLCTGDMGFGAAKTYDIEVYGPVSGKWFECSSISNCLDFQARRMKLRYRDENKKIHHCHTLNGSGLATPRVFVTLLETFQNADGSVTIPEVLRPYLGGIEKLEPTD
ncbi:MAG: serine--tRNA ligase, partial [Planctomycetota bacterium]